MLFERFRVKVIWQYCYVYLGAVSLFSQSVSRSYSDFERIIVKGSCQKYLLSKFRLNFKVFQCFVEKKKEALKVWSRWRWKPLSDKVRYFQVLFFQSQKMYSRDGAFFPVGSLEAVSVPVARLMSREIRLKRLVEGF